MKLRVEGIAHEEAIRIRNGGADANGQPALLQTADAGANPCRHCLGLIAEGSPMLVLSWRPFGTVQPYAESGPIFLHAEECERYQSDHLPAWFAHFDPAIVRGYDGDDWIRYETARVVKGEEIAATCESLLENPEVAYVHIRSKFNCFQCRVARSQAI
jgi:hypothetical protein